MKKLLSLILAVSLLLTGSALADELRLKYLGCVYTSQVI